MILFALTLVPIVAVFYFVAHAGILWIEGIIPSVCVGCWYAAFTFIINRHFPRTIGVGRDFPAELTDITKTHPELPHALPSQSRPMWERLRVTVARLKQSLLIARWGAAKGLVFQLENVSLLGSTRDLSYFFVAYFFLAGSASTALSVATVVAQEVFHANIAYIVAYVLVGLLTAIVGLILFRRLEAAGILSPRTILLVNISVMAAILVYVLFVSGVNELFLVTAVAGSQIGSIGAFTRSVVSRLAPQARQARLFSLWECIGEASGWVGPLIVASIAGAREGTSGRAFANIAVFVSLGGIAIGAPILCMVNIPRGEAHRAVEDRQVGLLELVSSCPAVGGGRGGETAPEGETTPPRSPPLPVSEVVEGERKDEGHGEEQGQSKSIAGQRGHKYTVAERPRCHSLASGYSRVVTGPADDTCEEEEEEEEEHKDVSNNSKTAAAVIDYSTDARLEASPLMTYDADGDDDGGDDGVLPSTIDRDHDHIDIENDMTLATMGPSCRSL
jgi:hypothetical protein